MAGDAPRQPEGFEARRRTDGQVEIRHLGRLAALLRGAQAARFLAQLAEDDDERAQHRMAVLTGNYKRGNERQARQHPRNRG